MLEKAELFSSMCQKEIDEIEAIAVRVQFSRGDYIFKQGDHSRDFYIIESGKVELSMKDFFHENRSIAILTEGEFFGEMALFDKNLSRSLDAQALHNVFLLKIPGDDFEALLINKPAISFKILGVLSKRLKKANERSADQEESRGKQTEGKTIVIASPRNGYGKTTLSTTLSQLLSNELGKRILYIDLDLYFGDGTFAMGVFSPKSILGFIENFDEEPPSWEFFLKYLVKHNENLYILPAPNDFIEGEKVKESGFSKILKESRKFFDYIIIDTDSSVNEIFLAAVDNADKILFLIDVHCTMSIKSDVRYFRGISHLNLPSANCAILATKPKEDFNPEDMRKLLSFKIIGVLPTITDIPLDYGQSIYQLSPRNAFCESIRGIFKTLFKITWLPGQKENGFFYRLFFPADVSPVVDGVPVNKVAAASRGLQIPGENSKTLLSFVHTNISEGYWDIAFAKAMDLLEIFPDSAEVLQVLGEVCFCQKNYQLGIDALQKALDVDPQNHYAMGILGIIQVDEILKKKSIEILHSKIQKNPGYPDFHNDLGKLLFSFKDFEGAKAAFLKALELNPNFSEARVNFAVLYGEIQEYNSALEQLRLVHKKSIRIHYLQGSFLFSIGKFFESLNAFTKVADENPHYLDVKERVETLRGYFQKVSNLMRMHQDLVKGTPQFPDLHYKMGNIFILMGNKEEALREFSTALELNPNYEDAKTRIEELAADTFSHFGGPPMETPSPSGEEAFDFELSLDKLSHFCDDKTGMAKCFIMMVKNVRSNREMAVTIPPEAYREGTYSFSCCPIGPICAGDLLLIQLVDDGTKSIFANLLHVVSEEERRNHLGKQDLSSVESNLWNFKLAAESTFRIPLQYFFVRFHCPRLGSLISGDDPPVRAEIKNVNTGIVAHGKCSAENPDESFFVLMSEKGEEVVREGDRLHFMLADRHGRQFFSMEFPVLKEDIDEFSKTVSMEYLEKILQGSQKAVMEGPQAEIQH